jgi:hypothetical protein
MSVVGEPGFTKELRQTERELDQVAEARRGRGSLGLSIAPEELGRKETLRRVADESIVPEKPETGSHADSVAQLHTFLEQRSRQWSSALRVMELQRQYVQAIEAERDAAYHKLAQVMEKLNESAHATKESLTRSGVNPVDLATTFERNRKVLEDLENVSVSLSTNFMCWRSAWEQYAQTAQTARKLGAEMKEAPSPRI